MSLKALVKDIKEQPFYLSNHSSMIQQIINMVKDLDLKDGYVLTGIATSYYSLQALEMLLHRHGFLNCQLINTADLLDYSYPIVNDKRPLFVLSRSGESAEIIRLLDSISPHRILVAITENASSPLAQRANYLCKFTANESAFTNTKSFTLSLTYALAIGIGVGCKFPLKTSEWINQIVESLNKVMEHWSDAEKISNLILHKRAVLIDAQGYLTGIANQACLDFQEIRMPAIPVTGGNMRHGTIELAMENNIAIIVLVPNDGTTKRKIELIHELHEKNRPVAAIVSEKECIPDDIPVVHVPNIAEELQPVVYAFVMHMIYSCFAELKGLISIQPTMVDKVTRKE